MKAVKCKTHGQTFNNMERNERKLEETFQIKTFLGQT